MKTGEEKGKGHDVRQPERVCHFGLEAKFQCARFEQTRARPLQLRSLRGELGDGRKGTIFLFIVQP